MAAGPAGPDPEARRVTAEMCRVDLHRPDLTDGEAEDILQHMYSVADVGADAFIELQGRTETHIQCGSLTELGGKRVACIRHSRRLSEHNAEHGALL